ncbi:hypothetical protein TIFTF001_018176 [Ficus carica]|uniref:Uncharacterized protein n=1 Tax=Ficus carica TaxID=3494 RepID=A0AA88AV90_FICCA|nr:hypothetical protein TIFTF001_018176 [Ficus carica]
MEAPQSDMDTGGVSATGTLMLKLVTGIRVTQSGRPLSAPNRRRIECCDKAPPPAHAGYHARGAACPGQQRRPRILPNLGTWQISMMWYNLVG